VIATRESIDGPGNPNAPGLGSGKNSAVAEPTGDATAAGAAGSPLSLQPILAQVKVLMRSGGMLNPSAALKTITLLRE